MVRGRKILDPSDAVVWMAAALLALLSGLGGGFVLWSVVAGLASPQPWRAAVYLGVLGLGVCLPVRQAVHLRLLVTLAAAALILSFTFGSVIFAPLVGG